MDQIEGFVCVHNVKNQMENIFMPTVIKAKFAFT